MKNNMNKFNKLYEDIFKPASSEEVKERKIYGKLEEIKDWMNKYNIKYTEDDKGNIINIDKDGAVRFIEVNNNYSINLVFKMINLLFSNRELLFLLDVLKNSGVDFNKVYSSNGTALLNYIIVYTNNNNNIKYIVRYLLENGVNPNNKNIVGGRNSLNIAYSNGYNDNSNLVKLLKQYGAKE